MKRLRMTPELYLTLFLALILIVLASFARGFFDLNNLMNMLNRFSYVLIAAVGMSLIILTGNIDVSTGSLISVVCLVTAALGKKGLNLWGMLPAAMATGAILSLLNALFITKFRIPAIVATLATAQLFSGTLPLVVEGSIYDLPDTFTWLAFKAKLFGLVPASALMMLIVAVLALVFMKYSRFAKKVYAVGNNPATARLAGIDVNKIVIACYVIAGCLFGVTATIIATAGQRVTTTMGTGLEMTFIAAVVLGGTSTSGGSGTILGTIIGCAVLSVIAPAINYMGISSDWSDAIMGAIIIIAVVVSELQMGKTKRPALPAERSAA